MKLANWPKHRRVSKNNSTKCKPITDHVTKTIGLIGIVQTKINNGNNHEITVPIGIIPLDQLTRMLHASTVTNVVIFHHNVPTSTGHHLPIDHHHLQIDHHQQTISLATMF